MSRWAGVSRTAVTKAAAEQFPDAVIDGKINVHHGLVREWLASHNCVDLPPPVKPTPKKLPPKRAKAKSRRKAPPKKPAPAKVEEPEPLPAARSASPVFPRDIAGHPFEELENLTVREVVMRYGSIDGFKRFVDSLKTIADFKFREVRNEQQRGELIDRKRVAGAVFPLIDLAYARLVSDVPASLAQLVVARVQSGGDEVVREVEDMIREANSKVLKGTKTAITQTGVVTDAN